MTGSTPLVFVSHSGQDKATAEALVALLRAALNLPPGEIRCTSVDGYRLPIGAETENQLRAELLSASVFLALISPSSLSSAYVLFELGGRWGAGKHLAPLLTPGLEPKDLKGPLQGINALSCDSEEQLHQLVHNLGALLSKEVNQPPAYLQELRRLSAAPKPRPSEVPAAGPQPAPNHNQTESVTELSQEHFVVLAILSNHHPKPLLPSDFVDWLEWKEVKVSYFLQDLHDRGHLWTSGHGYSLTPRGVKLVFEMGMAEG